MDVLPAHLNRDSFRDSFKGLVALEIILDLPFGFPINNIISPVDKKRVNSCVLKHLFLEGVEQPKKLPKKPEMHSPTRY